jgi:hypothetical protein
MVDLTSLFTPEFCQIAGKVLQIFAQVFTRWPYYITMSIIFSTGLTDKQIFKYKTVLKRHTHIFNPGLCHIWTGPQNKDDYGFVRVMFRGVRKNVCAYRLAYFLATDCRPLSEEFHVSHRCHNKLCVNVSHLSLELSNVNRKRDICRDDGECYGHRGHAMCIF